MASTITWRTTPSGADSGTTTPSPLKRVCAKTLVRSATSSSVTSFASGLPAATSTWRAAASSAFPSAVSSRMASSGKVSLPATTSPRSFSRASANFTAAITSGARTRPSLSVSRRASVAGSISSPFVGQARATQSFWSSRSMLRRSSGRSSWT